MGPPILLSHAGAEWKEILGGLEAQFEKAVWAQEITRPADENAGLGDDARGVATVDDFKLSSEKKLASGGGGAAG